MRRLASPRELGRPRQPARRSACPRGWPLAFGPSWAGTGDAAAGGTLRLQPQLPRHEPEPPRAQLAGLSSGVSVGRASGETGAGLGWPPELSRQKTALAWGRLQGPRPAKLPWAAAGLRCRRALAGAGPAAGRGGKSSAGGGKGSACVAWLDSRFPDRGREGSSSVAAATAGTVVLADSVGQAGAVVCAGSEVLVDGSCRSSLPRGAAPPRFPAEVTESNLDRWNAAPASASVSVSGRGSWGQRGWSGQQEARNWTGGAGAGLVLESAGVSRLIGAGGVREGSDTVAAAGRAAASTALSALGLALAFGSARPDVGLEACGVSATGCAIAGSCVAAIAAAEGEGRRKPVDPLPDQGTMTVNGTRLVADCGLGLGLRLSFGQERNIGASRRV